MIYQSFTTYAVSSFTNRHCIRFTEMAFVIVAVFESGRPQFVSKKKLHEFVVRRECRDHGRLQAEWKIGVKKQGSGIPLEVIKRRVERAGFERVEIRTDRVVGMMPSLRESDRVVARQIAKEEGWKIQGNYVVAA